MNATLSADGKIVIPQELRESAQLNPGDTLDIQLYKGTLLLRKHQPLSPSGEKADGLAVRDSPGRPFLGACQTAEHCH